MIENAEIPAEKTALAHVAVWVFDLDNTLYPASCDLFAQIDRRMTAFIAEALELTDDQARALRKRYYRDHGTTLRGLMDNHDIDPRRFLDYVHDIDHRPVPPNPALARALDRLDARKLVFTNASQAHAERVLRRLGIADRFEAVFDIIAADYVPKPDLAPYRTLLDRHAIDPRHAVFIDDLRRNLAPAAALGMTTLWVRGEDEEAPQDAPANHVHHVTDDLVSWLDNVAAARGNAP